MRPISSFLMGLIGGSLVFVTQFQPIRCQLNHPDYMAGIWIMISCMFLNSRNK